MQRNLTLKPAKIERYYTPGFSSLIFTFGASDFVSFFTMRLLLSVNAAVCLMSFEDEPIFTV